MLRSVRIHRTGLFYIIFCSKIVLSFTEFMEEARNEHRVLLSNGQDKGFDLQL
jgi:hypothetical protein